MTISIRLMDNITHYIRRHDIIKQDRTRHVKTKQNKTDHLVLIIMRIGVAAVNQGETRKDYTAIDRKLKEKILHNKISSVGSSWFEPTIIRYRTKQYRTIQDTTEHYFIGLSQLLPALDRLRRRKQL